MALKNPKTTKPIQKPQTARQAPAQQDGRKKEGRISRFWRETVGELRKVNWPTTQEATRLTKIVLVVMVIMSLALGLFDFVFSRLLALFLA